MDYTSTILSNDIEHGACDVASLVKKEVDGMFNQMVEACAPRSTAQHTHCSQHCVFHCTSGCVQQQDHDAHEVTYFILNRL